MLAKARETLVSVMTRPAGSLMYVQDTYANLPSIVQDKKIDFILLDIGVNMEHFKDGTRGFSVHEDAPLDMRFDTREGQTAADIVNTADKQTLMHMFVQYGDFAPKSAEYFTDNMIEARKKEPILTTKQLIDFFYGIGVRKNQLPVIFQCLRIQTNQELEQLETFLKVFPDCLAS
ncbi:16S rRNA (cytosine(1402)-N(4))-methyltransferase [Patescibacteria group bacterium]|nr:16S rRNA (cytosine(1402)-N(4))-methyltransferase [Patescibacteria group bacterium]